MDRPRRGYCEPYQNYIYRLEMYVDYLESEISSIEKWRKEYFWSLNVYVPTAQRALEKIMEK